MKWKTKITQMTGIKYPIIMGAFTGVRKTKFAAAFSNVGGLGIITALSFNSTKQFFKELQIMKN